jgi:hypothetical protein
VKCVWGVSVGCEMVCLRERECVCVCKRERERDRKREIKKIKKPICVGT